MVEALAAGGTVRSPSVLDAMRSVPRETFVPRFWAPVVEGGGEEVREWRPMESGGAAETALLLAYDVDRALALKPPSSHAGAGQVLSTASAPRVVGCMLELLELSPGDRVLEIGTGSGYNAALLRHLVGEGGHVTSVEIDDEVAAEAAAHLACAGYTDVELVVGDGYQGMPGAAPFDRVVATAGCDDIAPAWLDQLGPGGSCLLPLRHGAWHPVTRAWPDGAGAQARVEAPAFFVPLQGRHSADLPWPGGRRWRHHSEPRLAALPDAVTAALSRRHSGFGGADDGRWSLAYLLPLEDDRAVSLLALADGTSLAEVHQRGDTVLYSGSEGDQLKDRLVDVAELWLSLGCPNYGDYTSRLAPVPGRPPGRRGLPRCGGGGAGPERPGGRSWTVERYDFVQTVSLERAA